MKKKRFTKGRIYYCEEKDYAVYITKGGSINSLGNIVDEPFETDSRIFLDQDCNWLLGFNLEEISIKVLNKNIINIIPPTEIARIRMKESTQ